jgi:hypothetical protein
MFYVVFIQVGMPWVQKPEVWIQGVECPLVGGWVTLDAIARCTWVHLGTLVGCNCWTWTVDRQGRKGCEVHK